MVKSINEDHNYDFKTLEDFLDSLIDKEVDENPFDEAVGGN